MLVAAVVGDSREKIAADLGLVESTVKRHIHDLLAKTGEDRIGSVTTRFLRDVVLMNSSEKAGRRRR